VIDVEIVVRMLDHRHALPRQLELRDELLDQRRLARPRIPADPTTS
jgi:hypothetical protein